jgi:hypothetical protein
LQDDHDALRPGTRLGEFEILRVLGVGGFGIVYLAMDHALERQVAIKEYMPATLAARGEGSQVSLRSSSHVETFGIGLKSFVNEAKLLARFDHPSLVKVYRFWEANGTAYMVMPFYPGRTLKDERKALGQAPSDEWVRQLVEPLLGALELLHREGVYHRDIAPDNILVSPGAPPVLLDFGAARRVIGDRTQTLTAILKPNFAPIEQYADVNHLRQGPWTDLYALGAVLHFVVVGRPPSPAAARAVHDELLPLAAPGGPHAHALSLPVLRAIDWALAVRPNERPQSVAQMRDAMAGRLQPPERPVVDISMAPTLPADRVATAWAATAPLDGGVRAVAPPRGAEAAYEKTVLDVPEPPEALTIPALLIPPLASPPAGAATRPGKVEASARRRKRRLGWVFTGVAMVAVAAVSWWLGDRHGGNEPDVPVVQAAASLPAVLPPPKAVEAVAVSVPAPAPVVAAAAPSASQPAPTPRKPVARVATAPRPAPQPAPATAPAPERAAAPVAAAPSQAKERGEPSSPRQACGSRVFIAMWQCVRRECDTPRFHDHPQCRKLRQTDEQRQPRNNQ